jgi:NAD+ synthase (glutamine-hydrolysing)
MNKYGFVRVGVAIPELRVADCKFNTQKIFELIQQAENQQTEMLCFPELCITAYTCADLFFQQSLRQKALEELRKLLIQTVEYQLIFIVGLPVFHNNTLYNTAVVCQKGKILGIVPKTHIPNHNEFYEKRWFSSGQFSDIQEIYLFNQNIPFGTHLLFSCEDYTFGVEICEDLWSPIPPSSQLALHGAQILYNLSASNELIGKQTYRKQLIEQQSARCHAAYVYASAGMGESTTDLVFSGIGMIAENGKTLVQTERFQLNAQLILSDIDIQQLNADRMKNSNYNNSRSDTYYSTVKFSNRQTKWTDIKREINRTPFVPAIDDIKERCEEIFAIQTAGLIKRWQHTHAQTLLIGISGGLDSTLALLVAVKAADRLGFDRQQVMGITMPGFGTTNRTYCNALELMKFLGVTSIEIPIKTACLQHFKDIGQDSNNHDITYENTQARERTQILMDLANKHNGLVIGTGDLSELALGWTTYNGDHISMYAVNNSIPKTLVRYLIAWIATQMDENTAQVLNDILITPVSPELLPSDNQGNMTQFTEDVVGPYEIHDFFLYHFVRFGFSQEKILFLAKIAFKGFYTEDILEKWLNVFLKRFFSQQFKRSCMPDGPKVGSINLSPRGDWRMPSDAVIL